MTMQFIIDGEQYEVVYDAAEGHGQLSLELSLQTARVLKNF